MKYLMFVIERISILSITDLPKLAQDPKFRTGR